MKDPFAYFVIFLAVIIISAAIIFTKIDENNCLHIENIILKSKNDSLWKELENCPQTFKK